MTFDVIDACILYLTQQTQPSRVTPPPKPLSVHNGICVISLN